jgi:uncharacterized membrane protein
MQQCPCHGSRTHPRCEPTLDRRTLTTNSLSVLRHFVKRGNGATLIGGFAAFREIGMGELAALRL